MPRFTFKPRRSTKILFGIVLILALVRCCVIETFRQSVTYIPKDPVLMIGSSYDVAFVRCVEASICLFSLKDTHSMFGKNLIVHIKGYSAPRVSFPNCSLERRRGYAAIALITRKLATARSIKLYSPLKPEKAAYIDAKVLIDGVELETQLFETGLIAPLNMDIDWCAPDVQEWEV